MSDNAWDDLLVVQLFRGSGGTGRPRRTRATREGWLARWWRGVVRGIRWRGVRGGKTTPDYQRFMRSPAWAAQRRRVLQRDGYRCRWCGGRGREAHHTVYYTPVAATPDERIIALCEPCHIRAHADKQHSPTSRRMW